MLPVLRQYYENPKTKPLFIKACVFLIISLFVIYQVVDMTKSFLRVQKEKKQRKSELQEATSRLETLKNEQTGNPEFLKEKSVREKLHMVKDGEELIILVPEKEGTK